jgi:Holliday junction resolvase RusA-like endonuclease
MSFKDNWNGARRVMILRLLVKIGGEANDGVINTALEHGGFARDPRETYRADLDRLCRLGCTSDTWSDDVRVVRLTERGRMVAEGRIEVEGVECSTWHVAS